MGWSIYVTHPRFEAHSSTIYTSVRHRNGWWETRSDHDTVYVRSKYATKVSTWRSEKGVGSCLESRTRCKKVLPQWNVVLCFPHCMFTYLTNGQKVNQALNLFFLTLRRGSTGHLFTSATNGNTHGLDLISSQSHARLYINFVKKKTRKTFVVSWIVLWLPEAL